MGVSWHSNIPALWDHSDVRSDIAEHVRVIGSAVQGGATRARSRIVDILSNQVWTRDSQRIGRELACENDEDEELLSPLI
ncbi:unnamed protein product [Oikopleura dioica]|uniref:Uncharacterized protein n=1 Tax=Oikopleura dioica TaxID=34765 RepID=E4X0Z8_OIKDI|nr:unnamed protein product [Oikopleura dioica]